MSRISSKTSKVSSRVVTHGSVTSVPSRSTSGTYYLKPIRKIVTEKELNEFKKDVFIDDHVISFEELENRYDTSLENGLTKLKADDLLVQNGPNCLVAPETTSKWFILIKFLFGGFNSLIWAGSVLSFVEYMITVWQDKEHASLDTIWLGTVLALVALITGFFGFYMETTNSYIMDSFKKMIPKYATVVRSGEKYTIPSEELVLGDLVEIKSGDMVPGDMRILESQSLKVDNSAITGESVAVSRGPEFTHIEPLETMNLVFYGTSVVEGRGMGVIVKCGDDTVLGHIAGLTSSIKKEDTLLRKELNFFVKVISIIAFLIGTTLFVISLAMGYSFFKSFAFFIAIMVANVPEGLPVAFTVCMTLTAKRMAKKNCLIKKFEILETLGACNVICSDKTGTLTQNIMTGSHLYYDGSEYEVLTHLDDVHTESEAFAALCDVAILCSRASFAKSNIKDQEKVDSNKVQKIIGDASESAILRLMDKMVGEVEFRRSQYPKICEIPFTSTKKYQVSIHKLTTGRHLLVMKGAPEKVLEHCSTILREGEILPITPQTTKPIRRALMNLGKKGERVLAFADLYLSEQYGGDFKFDAEKVNFPLLGLRFVGMISLIDPPRPSVPEAVSKCRSAGIRIIMVTGDHPITAAAVARKVGIISQNSHTHFEDTARKDHSYHSLTKIPERDRIEYMAAVITGAELKEMSNWQLEDVLTKHEEIVFARTSPQQKLSIVEALQRLNKVVAVTGDGVNDSPALKKADIGIAMGITGSDVSKEAADMILLDDNFASIVTGIEEGRLIFDNLKKSVAYELTSNVPEIVPFVFLVVLNIPKAMSIMAILLIDIGTDLWAAVSLAYEKPEADIMKRSPRDPKKDKLINRRLIATAYGQIGIIQACAGFACYFYTMAQYGFFWEKLIGIREKWESRLINDLEDSYGQEWSYEMRQILTRKCIASYFLSIVITQIGDLLRCKTRRLSLLHQGMTNHVLNAGLMFEIFLAGLVVYCPKLNRVFDFDPIPLTSLVPAIPFCLLIVFYDEFRKYMIRRFPHKFFSKETYY